MLPLVDFRLEALFELILHAFFERPQRLRGGGSLFFSLLALHLLVAICRILLACAKVRAFVLACAREGDANMWIEMR
jgi:hypothetical protein